MHVSCGVRDCEVDVSGCQKGEATHSARALLQFPRKRFERDLVYKLQEIVANLIQIHLDYNVRRPTLHTKGF